MTPRLYLWTKKHENSRHRHAGGTQVPQITKVSRCRMLGHSKADAYMVIGGGQAVRRILSAASVLLSSVHCQRTWALCLKNSGQGELNTRRWPSQSMRDSYQLEPRIAPRACWVKRHSKRARRYSQVHGGRDHARNCECVERLVKRGEHRIVSYCCLRLEIPILD